MFTSRRALLSILAALCACVLALPATAAAAGTTVTVSLKLPAFHGKLTSSNKGCVANRTVRLFKVRSGPDKLLKSASSNGSGSWSTVIARKSVPSGTYYVKATARGKCKAGTSKRLVIP